MKTICVGLIWLLFGFAGCTGRDIVVPDQLICVSTLLHTWKLQALQMDGQPIALSNAQTHMTVSYSQKPRDFNSGSVTTNELKGSWTLMNCSSLTQVIQLTSGSTILIDYQIISLSSSQMHLVYHMNNSKFDEFYTPL